MQSPHQNSFKIKMRRTTISNLRQFLLALLLPAVAIATGLQSCNDEGPGILAEENGTAKSFENPLMRSPEEALDIAQRAYEDFYGEATPSSRGRSIIDCSRPVEVVRGTRSRGGDADTLLYIVNFVDDQGFAVIAAPRAADELLAVTSQGHYYPESYSEEEIPGFEIWMENACAYATKVPVGDDSIFGHIRDTTHVSPIGGGGISINPPITFDTTNNPGKNPNPNPEYGLMQQKEWSDTTIKSIILPQIKNSWMQGLRNQHDLYLYPEGYLFSNGLCGCGPLAVAQACLFFGEPTQIYVNGDHLSLDWPLMRKHRGWRDKTDDAKAHDDCSGINREPSHSMIAWLCRFIGDKANANEGEDGTGTKKENLLRAIKEILPNRSVSQNWNSFYNTNVLAKKNQIMIVRSNIENKSSGHAWVCDGSRWIEYDHYYATREYSTQEWTIMSKTHVVQKFNHFNWGWGGDKNGWYNQSVITLYDMGQDGEPWKFYEFQYVAIN